MGKHLLNYLKEPIKHSTIGISVPTSAEEVAFIDPTISELAVLLSVLRPGVQAIILNPSEPALAQIAASLKHRSGTTAIHIVAHGGSGEVRFAAGPLSLATI